MVSLELLQKYNVPVPRYTSYPTVPFWKDEISKTQWKEVFRKQFLANNSKEGISLYLHLPFCESLCTYCGCNKKITKNHGVESEYLDVILKEWELYVTLMETAPVIREIHLGGGTPTFFSPKNLTRLLDAIFHRSVVHPKHEFSIEGHPNNTTAAHLKALHHLGFRRISYGVQDNDPEVQRIINRIQPLENVKRATETARETGFHSVNFDLIYGLPRQTMQSIERTVQESIDLRPDRIAFYSYAHVPWTSRGQRLFDENDLPGPAEKIALYMKAKELFQAAGYSDIGMDHFALPHDDLFKAWKEGRLHRNFMGYTTQQTSMILGLGVSSISDAGIAFAQNSKAIHDYYQQVNSGVIPVEKGYFLDEEDVDFRIYIQEISCQGKTSFCPTHLALLEEYSFPQLEELQKDGLIKFDENGLEVTEPGRNFIRNICKPFDLHLARKEGAAEKMFSRAI